MKIRDFLMSCLDSKGSPIQSICAENLERMNSDDFEDLFMELGEAMQYKERAEMENEERRKREQEKALINALRDDEEPEDVGICIS